MKGDFSRPPLDVGRGVTRLLFEQGRAVTDADWNEQAACVSHQLDTLGRDLMGRGAGPAGSQRGFEIIGGNLDFEIGAGRYYVGGLPCHNDRPAPVLYSSEPLSRQPLRPGYYLAYLEAWERHISALEDPSMREPALGGADTATRTQVMWQVRLADLEPKDLRALLDGAKEAGELLPPPRRDRPTLQAQATGGYRGFEDQLYRVEVHSPGSRPDATIKWSRENGSVVFPIRLADGAMVTLGHLGRDARLSLAARDWVEVEDDDSVLRDEIAAGGPGQPAAGRSPLLQVRRIDGRVVTLNDAPGLFGAHPFDIKKHPRMRRWDQLTEPLHPGATWLALEHGIEIRFPDTAGNPGDHWLIPARVVTGDIDWPRAPDGSPAGVASRSVDRRTAPLAALAVRDGTVTTVLDLRRVMRPASLWTTET